MNATITINGTTYTREQAQRAIEKMRIKRAFEGTDCSTDVLMRNTPNTPTRRNARVWVSYDNRVNGETRTVRCQCEHSSHFWGDTHDYGAVVATAISRTMYGTFKVCGDCQSH